MFRNDINIDWNVSPRIITVAAPSITVTMQDLHDTLRTLESMPEALDDDSIISSSGKEFLGGSPPVRVGLTVTLLNAKLAFEARFGPEYVQCTALGGNLVALDEDGMIMSPIQPTAFTQVIIANSSSATILEITDAMEILERVDNMTSLIPATL